MKWFDNLNLGKKILSIIIIFSIFLGLITYISYSRTTLLGEDLESLYSDELLQIKYVNNMRTHNRATEGLFFQLMLAEISEMEKEELLNKIATRDKEYNFLIEEFKKNGLDAYEQEILSKVESNSLKYWGARDKTLVLKSSADELTAYNYYMDNADPLIEAINQDLITLSDYNDNTAAEANAIAKNDVASGINRIFSISLTAIIISVALGLFISRRINGPIQLLSKQAYILADGDFTIDVPPDYLTRQDEIGMLAKSLEKVVSNIRNILIEINHNAGEVAAFSQELAASGENMAATMEEASASAKD